MTLKQEVEKLLILEEKVSKHLPLIDGFSLTPIYRYLLRQRVLSKPGTVNTRFYLFRKIPQYIGREILSLLRLAFFMLKPLNKKNPLLFMCRQIDLQNATAGVYDKQIDPIIELLPNKYHWLKVSSEFGGSSANRDPVIFLPIPLVGFGLMLLRFTRVIKRHKSLSNVGIFRFQIEAAYVFYCRLFYRLILIKVRPKAVFLSCYYDPKNLGLVAACKDLNIPSIELQHGKQGKYHTMYGYWKRAESGATKLLPKYFWHWGEDSVQDSIKYVSKSYLERHQHLAMGNPWSSKWVNSSMNNFVSNGSKKFLKHIDKYKARLLISLQPIVDPLPKHLMIALNSLGPDYFVMFRLHPAMTSEKNKHADELARKLRVKHDIYFSSSTPLYALLKSCDLHLTAFSSVVYEAWAVGVPTIVYDRRGLELYKAEITDNKIFYAATSTSLKSQIEKVVSKRSKLKKQSYITLDHLTIKRNLKNLLNEID